MEIRQIKLFLLTLSCLLLHYLSECNMTICDSEAPPCDNGNRLVIGYSALSCCPEYRCGKNKHTFFFFCKLSVELDS